MSTIDLLAGQESRKLAMFLEFSVLPPTISHSPWGSLYSEV